MRRGTGPKRKGGARRHRRALSLFAAAVAAGAVAGAVHATGDPDRNPYTGDPAAIADGKRLWAEAGCYACHGADAGGAVGPDLTDDQWTYRPTDRTVFRAIAQGRRGTVMVGWSDSLSDDEIWKIVAWLRSLYRGDPGKIIW